MKFSSLICEQGQGDVVLEIIEEGNNSLEIGRYVLHNFWTPCQV